MKLIACVSEFMLRDSDMKEVSELIFAIMRLTVTELGRMFSFTELSD